MAEFASSPMDPFDSIDSFKYNPGEDDARRDHHTEKRGEQSRKSQALQSFQASKIVSLPSPPQTVGSSSGFSNNNPERPSDRGRAGNPELYLPSSFDILRKLQFKESELLARERTVAARENEVETRRRELLERESKIIERQNALSGAFKDLTRKQTAGREYRAEAYARPKDAKTRQEDVKKDNQQWPSEWQTEPQSGLLAPSNTHNHSPDRGTFVPLWTDTITESVLNTKALQWLETHLKVSWTRRNKELSLHILGLAPDYKDGELIELRCLVAEP